MCLRYNIKVISKLNLELASLIIYKAVPSTIILIHHKMYLIHNTYSFSYLSSALSYHLSISSLHHSSFYKAVPSTLIHHKMCLRYNIKVISKLNELASFIVYKAVPSTIIHHKMYPRCNIKVISRLNFELASFIICKAVPSTLIHHYHKIIWDAMSYSIWWAQGFALYSLLSYIIRCSWDNILNIYLSSTSSAAFIV